MKLSKIKIEKMANEIVDFLKKNEMIDCTCIYYNNKRINDGKLEDGEFDPHDYFEWAANDHILSMSFEGDLYDVINYDGGRRLDKFQKIFSSYGLYYELGDSWNLTCYPIEDNCEIEYTHYKKPTPTITIYTNGQGGIPKELDNIVIAWQKLQDNVGDSGSSVLGAGFEFDYRGIKYFMTPCSRYQGSLAWENDKDAIRFMLENIGATQIYYNWGLMD